MIRKITATLLAYVAVCLAIILISGHRIQATTALYNATFRIVNASGFVIGGTASATTASYNATAQIVDQNGTVLNPGTASGTSASPNLTIRVVDASGFVQSALGGPTPTPTPTPSFVVAANVVTGGGNTTTLTGAAAGDCAVEVSYGNNQFPTTLGNNTSPATLGGSNTLISGEAAGGGPPYFNLYLHRLVPQDTTTYSVHQAGNGFAAMVVLDFRNLPCNTDGISAVATATSTAPASTTYTTTVNNDVGIWALGLQGAGNTCTTPPTGYTYDTNAKVAQNNANNQGACVAYNLNLGAAAAQGALTGAITNSAVWAVHAFALQHN